LWATPFRPAAGALLGAGFGMALVLAAAETSPLAGLFLLVGLAVTAAVLLSPALGLLLTAALVPIERLGRLTDDSSMYTFSLMRVAGVLALGSFLLHGLKRRSRFRLGAEILLYAAYLGFALLTVLYTTDRLGTIRACGAILGNLLFFFLVVNAVRSFRLARAMVAVWLAVSLARAGYTVYAWHLGPEAPDETSIGKTESRGSTVWQDTSEWESLASVRRAMGPTSHAAVYGINLVLTLPFFLYFQRTSPRLSVKVALGAALALILYNVLLTNTRAVILLAAIVLALAVAWRMVPLSIPRVAGAILLSALLLPFVPQQISARVLDLSNYTYRGSGTFRIRLEYWGAALGVFERNWLGGVGVGNQNEIPRYLKEEGPEQTSAHNTYLQTLMEVGVAGGALFFGFVGLVFWRAARAGALFRRREGRGERYWFLVACQIATLAVLINGLQVDVFHFPLKGWWLAAGLGAALYGVAREEAAGQPWETASGARTPS
ncbi:MAG: O-antigen ligase family protein, partial [Gemmatimonadales bacterium]